MILGKAFEAPFNLATNFTARLRGYVIPPLTGEYVFWVANEGLSELWLSQDESPDNKMKIAEIMTDFNPKIGGANIHVELISDGPVL